MKRRERRGEARQGKEGRNDERCSFQAKAGPAPRGAGGDARIVLTPETAKKVLSKGRMALLSLLAQAQAHEDRPIESISELAERLGKPLEVVSRDLKILGNFGFIELRREGRRKKPILLRRSAVLHLLDAHPAGKGKRKHRRSPKGAEPCGG